MKIAQIQAKQGNIEVQAKVIEKGQERTFEKFGKQGKVCNAKIQDDSGVISLTLWNEQADQINVGDMVKITNGYASEYQNEKQLSTGKFGTLEVINMSSEDHGEHILTEDEAVEAEAVNEEMSAPEPEEEVTEDEMEEADLSGYKKPSESSDDIEVDEEKVE